VETVISLSLKKDIPKVEVVMEPDGESNYTPKEKAAYQKIKEYVKDKYGVKLRIIVKIIRNLLDFPLSELIWQRDVFLNRL